MFLSLLFATLLGTFLGAVAGLIPGIHPNLISVMLVSISPVLLNYVSSLFLITIIISMAIANIFLNIIPSVFLGAPDDDKVLSVLPGHRLLLQGKGHEAIMLTVIGSLASFILVLSLFPIFAPLMIFIYPILKNYIAYILIIIVFFLIFREKNSRFWAFSIFFISGILGLATLNIANLKEPLFPLLSGLFGTSLLITSVNEKVKIPKQIISDVQIDSSLGYRSTFIATLMGSLASFMPGLGPSQAAILGSQITKNLGDKGFLMLVGGLNTVNITLSFLTLYILNKARNGAVLTVSRIIETFNFNHLMLSIGCALVATGISVILTIKISKIFARLIEKINYKKLCLTIILFIIILVILISGFLGLLILIVSTFAGMLPTFKNIGKNHLMGCLLLPVILYFLL